jgi:hypothetical protein
MACVLFRSFAIAHRANRKDRYLDLEIEMIKCIKVILNTRVSKKKNTSQCNTVSHSLVVLSTSSGVSVKPLPIQHTHTHWYSHWSVLIGKLARSPVICSSFCVIVKYRWAIAMF